MGRVQMGKDSDGNATLITMAAMANFDSAGDRLLITSLTTQTWPLQISN